MRNNLVWMYRGNFILDKEKQSVDDFLHAFRKLLLSENSHGTLQKLEENIPATLQIKIDKVKRIFAYACWMKFISFDLSKVLTPQRTVDKQFFIFNMES